MEQETLHLNTGLSQDSILGPLQFILYVNDISHASELIKAIIYADDTTLTSNP